MTKSSIFLNIITLKILCISAYPNRLPTELEYEKAAYDNVNINNYANGKANHNNNFNTNPFFKVKDWTDDMFASNIIEDSANAIEKTRSFAIRSSEVTLTQDTSTAEAQAIAETKAASAVAIAAAKAAVEATLVGAAAQTIAQAHVAKTAAARANNAAQSLSPTSHAYTIAKTKVLEAEYAAAEAQAIAQVVTANAVANAAADAAIHASESGANDQVFAQAQVSTNAAEEAIAAAERITGSSAYAVANNHVALATEAAARARSIAAAIEEDNAESDTSEYARAAPANAISAAASASVKNSGTATQSISSPLAYGLAKNVGASYASLAALNPNVVKRKYSGDAQEHTLMNNPGRRNSLRFRPARHYPKVENFFRW